MKGQQMLKHSAAAAIIVLGLGCGGRTVDTLAEQGEPAGGAPNGSPNVSPEPSHSAPAKGGAGTGVARPNPPPREADAPSEKATRSAGAAGAAGATGAAGDDGGGGETSENAGAPGLAGNAGETGFAPAPQCAGLTFLPSTSLITGAFDTVAIPRVIYEYTAPGLVPASAQALMGSDGTFAGIAVKADPGLATDPMQRWLGVGLPLAGCVDARGYGGVKFTITGDLGSCTLTFGLVTSADNADGFAGSCHAALCLGPSSGPLKVGTTVVLFSDMSGGSPESRVNPATLNDLQWQFTIPEADTEPACVADFTVSEMSFVP
jgi:hypothetical protein